MEAKEVLEKSQHLYNQGQWQEAIDTINEYSAILVTDNDIAEAAKTKGWSYRYLGIKGPVNEKEVNLKMAKLFFKLALNKTKKEKTKISAMNGLPLVLLDLGELCEAGNVSNQAIEEFPDEPSVWNTRSILCKWTQAYEEAVEVGEKVYETAKQKQDYRTAGHGKHNKADALVKLGKTEEAKNEYKKAIELYEKHEGVSGESAIVHIESVRKKLADL